MKNMNKKTIILLCMSFLLVLTVFSCGTAEDAADVTEAEEFVPVVPAVPVEPAPEDSSVTVAEPVPEEAVVPEITEEPAFTEEKFVKSLQDVLSEGSVEEALALFEDIPVENEQSFDLNYLQASLLISSGDYEKAAGIADKLLEIQPANTDVLLLQSVIAKAEGNTAEKKKLLNQILEVDPDNSDANTELGNEYMLKKSWKLAREKYDKAFRSDPYNMEALAGYGKASYYLGNLTDAENAYNMILMLHPDNAFALAYLAKIYSEQERNNEAVEYARKAVLSEPGYFDYWLDYGDYLAKVNRFDEAEKAFTSAVNLRPDYFLGYVYRGGVYDRQEKFELAKNDYLKVAELRPEYYYIYESLAFIAWHDQDWTAAREWFQKAATANPKDTTYPMLIALCMYHEGNTRGGRDYIYKTVLKKFSNSSTEYAVMRLFYDNVADGTVAVKVQNESNSNTRGKMLFYLAQYYQMRGKDNLAQKYYIAVSEMEAPMFIEARLNDWALEQMMK